MPDIHAKLSASGSDRWMHCPGSVVLEEYFEDEGSEYASEGTQAHAIAETRMRARLDPTPQNVRNAEYDDWAWTCTPWSCDTSNANFVRFVTPSGDVYNSSASHSNGVAPACIFSIK